MLSNGEVLCSMMDYLLGDSATLMIGLSIAAPTQDFLFLSLRARYEGFGRKKNEYKGEDGHSNISISINSTSIPATIYLIHSSSNLTSIPSSEVSNTMAQNVWFIVGASSGFGKAIAEEVLRRGDAVVAASRRATALKDLEAQGATLIDLDVTGDDAIITAAFQTAIDKYGKITHFINAPGYLLEGPAEGASAKDALDSITLNVLAIMNLTRLEIAYLRPRKSGYIANFGSVASWHGGPAFSHYCASKVSRT